MARSRRHEFRCDLLLSFVNQTAKNVAKKLVSLTTDFQPIATGKQIPHFRSFDPVKAGTDGKKNATTTTNFQYNFF